MLNWLFCEITCLTTDIGKLFIVCTRRPTCVDVHFMSKYIGVHDVSWLLLEGSFNVKYHKMGVNAAVMGLGRFRAKLLSSDELVIQWIYIENICVLYGKVEYNGHYQKGS